MSTTQKPTPKLYDTLTLEEERLQAEILNRRYSSIDDYSLAQRACDDPPPLVASNNGRDPEAMVRDAVFVGLALVALAVVVAVAAALALV